MASTLERRVSLSQPAHSQQLTHSRGRSAPIQVHEADVYSLLQESDACAQQAAPPAERPAFARWLALVVGYVS